MNLAWSQNTKKEPLAARIKEDNDAGKTTKTFTLLRWKSYNQVIVGLILDNRHAAICGYVPAEENLPEGWVPLKDQGNRGALVGEIQPNKRVCVLLWAGQQAGNG